MKRRVAVTGLGAFTAAGEGAMPLWRAALEGRPSAAPLPFETGNGHKPAGAAVKDFVPEKFVVQRKSLKVMARDIQLAVAAATLAVDDAGIREWKGARSRFGVLAGAGVLNHELDELGLSVRASLDAGGRLDMAKFGDEGLGALFPLWLLKYLPNMPACHISILFDLQGPNNTITTGASSGLQAVNEAYRIIARGSADAMLAGGAESKLNPLGYSHYELMGVLADGAYRPFDASASGFVIGEGAAFLVLEEWEHAKARGAKIYAEIAGAGSSSAEGREAAMRAALDDAGAKPADVAFVHACGIGVPEEDAAEAHAIEAVFGARKDLAVTSTKPVTGFTGFSSGPVDLILSVLALKEGELPPLANFERAAKPLAFHLVTGRPARTKGAYAVTNAAGLGAPCVSVVTRAVNA